MALSWHSLYRMAVLIGMALGFAIVLGWAWHRLKQLAALGDHSFAASRRELAADLHLLKRT